MKAEFACSSWGRSRHTWHVDIALNDTCRIITGCLKAHEKKLEVAEMRMLRWMCGVTKLDKIRNERIRGTTKVGEITKKVQERRLKWYGHVMRREEHYVGRRGWK